MRIPKMSRVESNFHGLGCGLVAREDLGDTDCSVSVLNNSASAPVSCSSRESDFAVPIDCRTNVYVEGRISPSNSIAVDCHGSKVLSRVSVSMEKGGISVLNRGKGPSCPSGPPVMPGPLIRGSTVPRKAGARSTRSHMRPDALEDVEDIFGQLWMVPSPPRHRPNPKLPPPPAPAGSLFWICKDLVAAGSFLADDCHPAIRRPFDPNPIQFHRLVEGIGPGSKSFAEVVKGEKLMADRRGGPSSSTANSGRGAAVKTNPAPRKQVSAPVGAKEPAPAQKTKSTASTAASTQVRSHESEVEQMQVLDPKYAEMICFNCEGQVIM